MFSEKVDFLGVSVLSVCHFSCTLEARPLRSHDHFMPWLIAVFAPFCPRSVSPLDRSYKLSRCQTLFFSALLQSFCCQPLVLGPLFSASLSLFTNAVVFFGGVFKSLFGAPSSEHLTLSPKLSPLTSQPDTFTPRNLHPPTLNP